MAEPISGTTALIIAVISGTFGLVGIGVGVAGPFITGFRQASAKAKEDAAKAVIDMAAIKADNRVQLQESHNKESSQMQVEREKMWDESRKMREDLSNRIDALSLEVKGLKATILLSEAERVASAKTIDGLRTEILDLKQTITGLRDDLKKANEGKQAAESKIEESKEEK